MWAFTGLWAGGHFDHSRGKCQRLEVPTAHSVHAGRRLVQKTGSGQEARAELDATTLGSHLGFFHMGCQGLAGTGGWRLLDPDPHLPSKSFLSVSHHVAKLGLKG